MKKLTISLITVIILITPSIALAKEYHMSASPSTKLAQAQTNQQTRINNAKQRGDNEIQKRITSLNSLISKINSVKKISDANKAAMVTQVNTEIANLNTLKAKIDADTDITTLKTDLQGILDEFRVYALFIPRIQLIGAADTILQAGDKFTDIESRLQTLINTASSQGKDVTSLNNSLTDIKAKVADSEIQANNAINTLMALTPQKDISSYRPAFRSAHQSLEAARQDLVAARQDTKTIIQGLKAMNVSTASTSATTK